MKFFYSISFFLLIAVSGFSQTRTNPVLDPPDRIVKFYPNPAVTRIHFDFQDGYEKSYSFQIYNFIGKKVYELTAINSPKTTVDLTDYFRGIYIFQLKDKNGKMIESGKFQVTR